MCVTEARIDPSEPATRGVVDELDRLDRTQLAISFERMFTLARRLNPQGDISLTAASTLRTLERHGPHRLSELAAKEGVTQPAMTQLVSRLERAGLAQRCADPGDGRVVVVSIADAGRELLQERREGRTQKLYQLLSSLTPADRAAIVAALPALDRLADLLPS
jgi:DNA-binding MarR family transcriptional regulator